MTKLRVLLICWLLALTGNLGNAAVFGGEKKAYDAASEFFRLESWERAEREFASFIRENPSSPQVLEATLYQAQAQYQQRKYAEVIALLQSRETEAGVRADQFVYWIGKAQYEVGDFTGAATTFGRLARNFPSSPKRLEAAVSEAAARAKLGDWTNVVELLRRPDGPFQLTAQAAPGSEMTARGYLLQAEGQLRLKLYPEAEASLKKIAEGLGGELGWQRRFLLSRSLVARGRTEEAATESVGMIAAAEGARQWELLSDSVVFHADLLEQLGRRGEALTTLRRNLTNAPVARQRQALLRITALALQENQLTEATRTLELFLTQHTNAAATDVAWLTLGELHLKQHVGKLPPTSANSGATNHFEIATNSFQRVLKGFPGSAYVGKAQLNLGWSYWVENRLAESETAFAAAVIRLPASEDQAVAQFKLADAQFARGNFPAALTNYQAVLQVLTNWPVANQALRTPASYQLLRTSLAVTNTVAAEAAMRGILASDLASAEAISSVLLVAQAYLDGSQPEVAQRLFGEFLRLFPESNLQPEVELLVARMREEQGDWAGVAATYDAWLERYGTNRLRPQVEFQRALAAGLGGETNALPRFTNFVAQFPTHRLAPRAQWWVADWYYQQGNFQSAEISYKQLFTTWRDSELAHEARMMAGRAAVQRFAYADAIEHFTSLTSDTNGPAELRMQAYFAYGGAVLKTVPTATNKVAELNRARQVFAAIVAEYPTNALAAAAYGEMGNCALNMAAIDPVYYNAASNAYQQAILFPGASVGVRSQAKVGLASVLEKQAQLAGVENQANLLKQARDQLFDLYVELGIHPQAPDPAVLFWRRKAGLEAARLDELLNEWRPALALYRDLLRLKLVPAEALERRIAAVERQLRPVE